MKLSRMINRRLSPSGGGIKGGGTIYSGSQVAEVVWDGLGDYKGTVADGKRIFQAALCSTCHRMKGEGANAGPDLTEIESKFSKYDLIFSIVSPNDEISDQYAYTLFETNEGRKVAGRILSEKGNTITISPNPYDPSVTIDLEKAAIIKKELSPVSPMPPGLLNRLNEQELLDLMAYLFAGGDEKHKIYTGVEEEE